LGVGVAVASGNRVAVAGSVWTDASVAVAGGRRVASVGWAAGAAHPLIKTVKAKSRKNFGSSQHYH